MSKFSKKLFALVCAAVILAGANGLPVFAVYSGAGTLSGAEPTVLTCVEIPLYIDNEYIGPAYVVDSIPCVPLRAFTECMLQDICEVAWDQETGTAMISSDALVITLSKDRGYLIANDRYFYLGGNVYNVNGTLIVPLRAVADIFSLELELDTEEWAIRIDTGNIQIPRPAAEVYDATELYWLSRVISSEAKNQSLDGMIGVGNVVLNRVRDQSGAFGNDILSVIFQSGQFDVVTNGTIYETPCEQAVIAAKLCMEGYSTVGNSMWFVNPTIGVTTWFDIYKTYTITIGDHIFYT